MKQLLQVYESISMDDEEIMDKQDRDLATAGRINEWFKDNCISLYSQSTKYYSENESYYFRVIDGKVHIRTGNFGKGRDILISQNLPSYIKFADPDGDAKSLHFILMGSKVTSMKGLPDNMPDSDILINLCENFDFSDCETKNCGVLTIRDSSIKSLKHAPKAKAYKLKNCKDLKFNEKEIARFSGTNRSRITIIDCSLAQK